MIDNHFNTQELSFEELTEINGGESGWYYLGRAARAIADFIDGCGDPAHAMGHMDLPISP